MRGERREINVEKIRVDNYDPNRIAAIVLRPAEPEDPKTELRGRSHEF